MLAGVASAAVQAFRPLANVPRKAGPRYLNTFTANAVTMWATLRISLTQKSTRKLLGSLEGIKIILQIWAVDNDLSFNIINPTLWRMRRWPEIPTPEHGAALLEYHQPGSPHP
jgi:hypothetical protein